MDISVIIVTFNHEHEIKECLYSLSRALASYRTQIVIIDNNSTDSTIEIAQKLSSYFSKKHQYLIQTNTTNKGFTIGVNQGLSLSTGNYILILNPDVILPSDVFIKLIPYFEKRSYLGILSPQFLNPDGSIQLSCRRFPRHRDLIFNALGLNLIFPKSRQFNYWKMGDFDHRAKKEVHQPQGAFLLTHREAIDQIGLLDESFPMFFSDVDWCRRFFNKGWKILFVPGVKIIHHKGSSVNKHRFKMIWSSHRSFYYYFKKYYNGFFWSCFNYLTGLILIFLALMRSIFYLIMKPNS